MKKMLSLVILMSFVLAAQAAFAYNIYIGVDAAPNVYGSPDYAGWRDNAFAALSSGTFVNMAHGINPANVGTANFEIEDIVVYSFGDLGKRLSFVYWIPDATIAELGSNFQINLSYTWDGASYDLYQDYYSSHWLTPSSWVDYDSNNDTVKDSVAGVAGNGWWGAYGINTLAALMSDMDEWRKSSESWTFSVRILDDGEVVAENSLTAYRTAVTPEPGTMLLMGVGAAGAAFMRRRRNRKAA